MSDKVQDTKHISRIKKFRRNAKKYLTRDLLSSLYEFLFVDDVHECPYFAAGLESFAVLLKGKSLEQLYKYDKEFEQCFLVNNFDEEIKLIGDSLDGKECVHFVNRLMTAPLQKKHYERFNITKIQLPKVSAVGDRRLKTAVAHYKSLGLKTHFLPKKLLEFNKQHFDEEYAKKYPNTGIVAIIYALEMLRPNTLWIVGLDFYQSDYLVRRPHANPIELQQEKMKRLDMVGVTAKILSRYPDVQINMVSYYKGFPAPPNVEILS